MCFVVGVVSACHGVWFTSGRLLFKCDEHVFAGCKSLSVGGKMCRKWAKDLIGAGRVTWEVLLVAERPSEGLEKTDQQCYVTVNWEHLSQGLPSH